MKLIDAYTFLRSIKTPFLLTQDVSAFLKISINHANKILSRLASAGQLIHIGQSKWIFTDINPMEIPEILTSPLPTYISLQTALYMHGMVSQIPNTIYAVSLARTKVYKTKVANFSIHHVQPNFFFGFTENDNLKIATPEKALIDILYLSPGRSRLFSSLPEIEFPKTFNFAQLKKIINQISSPTRKSLVQKRLDLLIK